MNALRWRTAHAIDRLPRMCWARLVGWALRDTRLRDCRIDWACRDDLARNGTCYCGKLRKP